MVAFTVRLDDALHGKAKHLADLLGMSMQTFVEDGLMRTIGAAFMVNGVPRHVDPLTGGPCKWCGPDLMPEGDVPK